MENQVDYSTIKFRCIEILGTISKIVSDNLKSTKPFEENEIQHLIQIAQSTLEQISSNNSPFIVTTAQESQEPVVEQSSEEIINALKDLKSPKRKSSVAAPQKRPTRKSGKTRAAESCQIGSPHVATSSIQDSNGKAKRTFLPWDSPTVKSNVSFVQKSPFGMEVVPTQSTGQTVNIAENRPNRRRKFNPKISSETFYEKENISTPSRNITCDKIDLKTLAKLPLKKGLSTLHPPAASNSMTTMSQPSQSMSATVVGESREVNMPAAVLQERLEISSPEIKDDSPVDPFLMREDSGDFLCDDLDNMTGIMHGGFEDDTAMPTLPFQARFDRQTSDSPMSQPIPINQMKPARSHTKTRGRGIKEHELMKIKKIDSWLLPDHNTQQILRGLQDDDSEKENRSKKRKDMVPKLLSPGLSTSASSACKRPVPARLHGTKSPCSSSAVMLSITNLSLNSPGKESGKALLDTITIDTHLRHCGQILAAAHVVINATQLIGYSSALLIVAMVSYKHPAADLGSVISSLTSILHCLNLPDARVSAVTEAVVVATQMATPIKGEYVPASNASMSLLPCDALSSKSKRKKNKRVYFSSADASSVSPPKDHLPSSWDKTKSEITRLKALTTALHDLVVALPDYSSNSAVVQCLLQLCRHLVNCSDLDRLGIVSMTLQVSPASGIAERAGKEAIVMKDVCQLIVDNLPQIVLVASTPHTILGGYCGMQQQMVESPGKCLLEKRSYWLRCACIRAHLRWLLDAQPVGSSRQSAIARACAATMATSTGYISSAQFGPNFNQRSGFSDKVKFKHEESSGNHGPLISQIFFDHTQSKEEPYLRFKKTPLMSTSCLFSQALKQFLRGHAAVEFYFSQQTTKSATGHHDAWRASYLDTAARIATSRVPTDALADLALGINSTNALINAIDERDTAAPFEFETMQLIEFVLGGELARRFLLQVLSTKAACEISSSPLNITSASSAFHETFWTSLQMLAQDERTAILSNKNHHLKQDQPLHYFLLSMSFADLLALLRLPMISEVACEFCQGFVNGVFYSFHERPASPNNNLASPATTATAPAVPTPTVPIARGTGTRGRHQRASNTVAMSNPACTLFLAPVDSEALASTRVEGAIGAALANLPLGQKKQLLNIQNKLFFKFPFVEEM